MSERAAMVSVDGPGQGDGLPASRAEIVVDFPATRRGIHMSRMEEAISIFYERDFDSSVGYIHALAREVAATVRQCCHLTLPPRTGVEVDSIGLESIHIHDVNCRLRMTLGETGDYLD